MNNLSIKNIYLISLISLALGIAFDYLFFDREIGISFFIYITLLTSTAFGLLSYLKISYRREVYWFLPPILFFSSFIFIKDNPFLIFFNLILTLALLLLLAHQLIGRNIKYNLLLDYLKTAIVLPFSMLNKSFLAIGRIISTGKNIKMSEKKLQVTKGIIITIPVAIIFLLLLSSADLAFKNFLDNVFNINFRITPELLPHIFWTAFFTVVWLGVYTYILENATEKRNISISNSTGNFKLGRIEAGILFSTLNVLFLFFVVVQIKYLFAGHNAISQLGFTYAEYAHKGFGELILVSILIFGLIFLADKYIERQANETSKFFKISSIVLIAFVLVITASAFTRLGVYEQAYGFTVLRILVQAFIIWLAAVFLWLAYKIINNLDDKSFIFGLFISVIAFFVIFNLFNPDSFVAKKNIKQFSQSGTLDTNYLAELSGDAVPTLIPLLDRADLKDKNNNNVSVEVAVGLKKYYDYLKDETDWQSYNYSRNRAMKLIGSRLEQITNLAEQSTVQEQYNTPE